MRCCRLAGNRVPALAFELFWVSASRTSTPHQYRPEAPIPNPMRGPFVAGLVTGAFFDPIRSEPAARPENSPAARAAGSRRAWD